MTKYKGTRIGTLEDLCPGQPHPYVRCARNGRPAYAAPPREALACSTRLLKAAASFTAKSDRILRSSSTPAFFSPLMNWLELKPFSLAAAPMRTIQSERNWRFFWRQAEKANLRPRSTASLADRYSLDFVR